MRKRGNAQIGVKSAEPWQILPKRLLFYHPGLRAAGAAGKEQTAVVAPLSLSSGLLPAASHYVCRDQREGEADDEGKKKNEQRGGKCLPSFRVLTSFRRKNGEKSVRLRRDKIEKEGANIPTDSYSH